MKSSRRKRRQAAAKRRKLLRNAAKLNSNVERKDKIGRQIKEKHMSKKREAEKKAEREATVERDASQGIAEISDVDMTKVIETITILEEKIALSAQKYLSERKEAFEKQTEQQISVEQDEILLSVRTSDDMARDLLQNLEKLKEKYISKKEDDEILDLSNYVMKHGSIEGTELVDKSKMIEKEAITLDSTYQMMRDEEIYFSGEEDENSLSSNSAITKEIFEELISAGSGQEDSSCCLTDDEVSSEDETEDETEEIYASDDEDIEPELQPKKENTVHNSVMGKTIVNQIYEEILVAAFCLNEEKIAQVEDIGADLLCPMGMQVLLSERAEEKAEYTTERGEATSMERVVQLLALQTNHMSNTLLPTTTKKEAVRRFVLTQLGRELLVNHEAPSLLGGYLIKTEQREDTVLREKNMLERGDTAVAAARVKDALSTMNEPFRADLRRRRHDNLRFHEEIRSKEKKLNQERVEVTADPAPQGDLTTTANTSRVNRNAAEMHQRTHREPTLYKLKQNTLISQLIPGGSDRSPRRHKAPGRKVSKVREFSSGRPRLVEASSEEIRQGVDIFVYKDEDKPSFKRTVEAVPYLKANNIPTHLWSDTLRGFVEKAQIRLSRMTRADQKAFLNRLVRSKLVESRGQRKSRVELPHLTPEEMKVYTQQMERSDAASEGTLWMNQPRAGQTTKLTVSAEVHEPPNLPTETAVRRPRLRSGQRTCAVGVADEICVDEIKVLDAVSEPPERDACCEYLPSEVNLMGEEYAEEMLDLFLATNPSLDLRVGENVFCTSQTNPDMLCFAHSTITALLNLDSVKHAASVTGGPMGEALTKFCLSTSEPEKHGLVRWLAREMFDDAEMPHPQGHDAAVFMRRLLERLHSEAWSTDDVFSQDLEVSSHCPRCGGARTSRRREVMSFLQKKESRESRKESRRCVAGEGCTDGEIRRTVLLNSPDAVVKVNTCRRDSRTYGESAKVPYDLRGRGGTVYNLKFCLVHIGHSPSGGHFVTVLTNPLDREQCILVDDGKVRRMERADFEEFARMSYVVGYERVDVQTIPKPSTAETLRKIEARSREVRRQKALENIAFLRNVSNEVNSWEAVIEESYNPGEAKKWLTRMLRQRTHTEEAGPLLSEENRANAAAELLHRHFMSYEQSTPWSVSKKLKFFFGLYTDRDERKVRALSKGLVLGAGQSNGLLDNADMTEEEDGRGGRIFRFACRHCRAEQMSKKEILEHIGKGRCRALRRIDRNFRITPRNIARGIWRNPETGFTLSVIRPHNEGNITRYTWDDGRGARFSCVVKTTSTTQMAVEHNRGQETDDGFFWYGRGYCQDKDHLLAAKEEIMYKEPSEKCQNFPVWSVLCQVYNVRGWRREQSKVETGDGAVNLDVVHPAENPNNRKFLTEFEIILVASAKGENFKMVLRRPNLPDEELTEFEDLTYVRARERPVVDEDILRLLENHRVSQYVSKAHLPAVLEQPAREPCRVGGPFKFENEGQLLCWVNSSLQVLLHTRPDIGRQLCPVLQQHSHLSGARDVPRMIWEIIRRPAERQSLDGLRNLLAPQNRDKDGTALLFFELLVESLNAQAPAAVESFAVEKRIFFPDCPCPTEGCEKTLPSSVKFRNQDLLQFPHLRDLDGLSSQNAIDRKLGNLAAGLPLRTCSDGHATHAGTASVTIVKRPEVFLVVVGTGRSLDQHSSMEVKLGGATYRAEAIIHHIPADAPKGVGHHYCSLFDAEAGEWRRIDDFRGRGNNWTKSYRFDETEKVFKVGSRQLFENLGIVFYKRTSEEEGRSDPDARRNFHTYTGSGQQVLLGRNLGQGCYAIQLFAGLLSNPDIHDCFRNFSPARGTRLELFLRGLCHQPDRTVATNIEVGRALVVEELRRFDPKSDVVDFRRPVQQDADEFLRRLIETMCLENIEAADGSVVLEAPLSKEHRQKFRDILGYTCLYETACTVPNCTMDSRVRGEQEFVLSVEICADSVNGCIREGVLKANPLAPADCDYCRTKNAIRKQTLKDFLLKKCIIVQLKRFDNFNQKIDRRVTVDEVLTEGPFSGYKLTGAILHNGVNTTQGHYTHIMRDVEDGTYVKTNDHTGEYLTTVEAAMDMAKEGYIMVYSRPDRFPPALKTDRPAAGATLEEVKSASTGTEQTRRRSLLCRPPQNSTFRIREVGDPVSLPPMPVTPNLTSLRRTLSPTAREIADKLEIDLTTSSRKIDPADELAQLLRTKFGHDDFRSAEQLAAVREIIAGLNDVMVIMSTGSGKSLIYQLAAIALDRLSVIVGPLLSLANDQVKRLRDIGIEALLYNHEVCMLNCFLLTFPLRRRAA